MSAEDSSTPTPPGPRDRDNSARRGAPHQGGGRPCRSERGSLSLVAQHDLPHRLSMPVSGAPGAGRAEVPGGYLNSPPPPGRISDALRPLPSPERGSLVN